MLRSSRPPPPPSSPPSQAPSPFTSPSLARRPDGGGLTSPSPAPPNLTSAGRLSRKSRGSRPRLTAIAFGGQSAAPLPPPSSAAATAGGSGNASFASGARTDLSNPAADSSAKTAARTSVTNIDGEDILSEMNGRTHHDIEDDEDEDDGGDAGAATAAGMCGADDEDRTFRVKRCGSRCHLLSAKRLGDDPPAGCRSAAAGSHRPHDQEALLQFLCDMDGGFSVLLGRAKLNMAAMKDVVGFLKRRAHLEEEYGRGMLKLVQSCSSAATEEGRADPGGASGAKGGGSYGEAWAALLRIHEAMGQNRVGFAAQISEIADDLFTAYKGADRSRKQLKDAGMKHEKAMQEADAALEKARLKYETSSEEWERSILQKNGDILGNGRKTLKRSVTIPINLFKSPAVPAKLEKLEEDARYKAAVANETYKHQLHLTNALQAEYSHVHLPQILRSVRETIDESDCALQYQLGKYAFCFEAAMMADATALSPLDDGAGCEEQEDEDGSQSTAAAPPRVPGLRAVVEQIDGTRDLERYVLAAGSTAAASAAAAAQGRGAMLRKADVLSHEYGTPARGGGGAASLPRPIFGVDLAEQLQRDEREVPPILVKCARAIEAHAIRTQGLYRISGSSAEVQALRALFDRNYDHVELTRPASGGSSTASAAAETEAGAGAVAGAGPGDLVDGTAGGAGLLCNPHSIAGVLKLYFRELPDPLLTSAAYAGFVDAARIADGAARVVAMHDRVNALPDANYATLRCLMRHLHAVQAHQRHNRMGVSNLGIIFGPTLMGSPPAAADLLNDMTHQCRVVETILENYRLIFEPDE